MTEERTPRKSNSRKSDQRPSDEWIPSGYCQTQIHRMAGYIDGLKPAC